MFVKCEEKEYARAIGESKRYKKKFDLVYQWMKLKQNNIELIEFFEDRKLTSIALYGVGDLGRLIYNELKAYKIIKCGIDRQADKAELDGAPVYSLKSINQKVDAIVITPVLITDTIEDNIYNALGEQTTFTFEEILFDLSEKHGLQSELWPV